MTARDIAAALGGRWHGSYGMVRCPCHADKTPSCKVTDDQRKNDGIDVVCFAGCEWRPIKAELRRLGLIGDFEPDLDRPGRCRRPELVPEPEPDEEAVTIWRAAAAIDDTLAEHYLRRHRGLTGPFPASLRFIPSIMHSRIRIALPGLVAALQRPDRRLIAVQVTYLRPSDGAKASLTAPRLMFGKMGTGAVRLAAAGTVIGIAEGIETALSAMQMTGLPTWATLGGKRLSRISVPGTVREICIFADDDDPGHHEATKAAACFTAKGLRVRVLYPPEGFGDFNDALRASRESAAA